MYLLLCQEQSMAHANIKFSFAFSEVWGFVPFEGVKKMLFFAKRQKFSAGGNRQVFGAGTR